MSLINTSYYNINSFAYIYTTMYLYCIKYHYFIILFSILYYKLILFFRVLKNFIWKSRFLSSNYLHLYLDKRFDCVLFYKTTLLGKWFHGEYEIAYRQHNLQWTKYRSRYSRVRVTGCARLSRGKRQGRCRGRTGCRGVAVGWSEGVRGRGGRGWCQGRFWSISRPHPTPPHHRTTTLRSGTPCPH